MKITSVDIVKAVSKDRLVKDGAWTPIFVRINTDEGIRGYGEVGLCYGNLNDGGYGAAVDFSKLIIGMDAMGSEEIWDKLHRMTFWGMGGGAAVFSGIAAIDIALWDIKGKALKAPVYQLLGGKRNKKLRTYASQIQFDWGGKTNPRITPEHYADATRKAMAEGYTCVKVDPVGFDLKGQWMGWSNYGLLEYDQLKIAVDRVAAIRETGGPAMDIIIELHSLTDTNTAIQLGRELEKFRCFYMEEPTQPLYPNLFREIASQVRMPLASGERMYGRWAYLPFFQQRSLSIIQPDLCNTGGITEGKKICDMAHAYDIGVQIHVCGGPISTAAALQLEAVIPNFVIHEHHAAALLPSNIELCKYDYQPKNGYFETPDLPGIGQEVTDETFKKGETITIK